MRWATFPVGRILRATQAHLHKKYLLKNTSACSYTYIYSLQKTSTVVRWMLFGEFLMIRIGWMNLVLVSKITILFWKIVCWIIHNACSISRVLAFAGVYGTHWRKGLQQTTPHLYGKFIVSDIDAGLKGGTRLVGESKEWELQNWLGIEDCIDWAHT